MTAETVPGNQPVTRETVMRTLSTCNDPELGIDIVSLGLIYTLDVSPKRVAITMTLTTPACPLAPYFQTEIHRIITAATGIDDVDITISFDPPWSPEKMSPSARAMLTMSRS